MGKETGVTKRGRKEKGGKREKWSKRDGVKGMETVRMRCSHLKVTAYHEADPSQQGDKCSFSVLNWLRNANKAS